MNKYFLLGIPLFFASIILIGYDVLLGNGKILLVIFVPVFYGNGVYFMVGAICLVTAIFLAMIGSIMRTIVPADGERRNDYAYQPQTIKKTKIAGGGIVFIGPIPIIISADKRTAIFLAIISLVSMFVMLFIVLFFYNLR